MSDKAAGQKARRPEGCGEESLGPGLANVLTPPFSLQLLVENAVQHGLQSSPNGGRLRLLVGLDGEWLEMSVSDEVAGPRGDGLPLLRRRLEGLFGDSFRLEVCSELGKGTKATMRIPLLKQGELPESLGAAGSQNCSTGLSVDSSMWIRIRAVIVEDEPLAAQYLATLLDETLQVEVVGTATDTEAGLRLCAELRPDAVFLDINLPGKDGVSLATQLAMLPQPPRVVFTTGSPARATDAFRLDAVDYLLKPLDPEQISEAVGRLLAILRPFETEHSRSSDGSEEVSSNKMVFTGATNELLPVKDIDRDKIRLLARYQIAAILRHDRRTWVHTVREEFATARL